METRKPVRRGGGTTFVPGTERTLKPRDKGITMVIDKGLGLAATEDLLHLAAEHIDFVKFGFGTAALYAPDALQRKVHLIAEAGVHVLPGGTLLELAVHDGTVASFLAWARWAGFTYVEVSDGTIELPQSRRQELIERCKDMGFGVLSEVGKKDPRMPLDVNYALEQIDIDLDTGAEKVIVEGRDSGSGIGIFNDEGAVRKDLFERLAEGIATPEDVIWEAPRPIQQQVLLTRLGPHTNFGNVQPEDVITLEAMRRGLRGDTLRLLVQATVQGKTESREWRGLTGSAGVYTEI